jgi:hypothetical protein
VLRATLALLLLAGPAAADASAPTEENLAQWREIAPYAPRSDEEHCAAESGHEWSVRVDGGRVKVGPPPRLRRDRQLCRPMPGTARDYAMAGGTLVAQDSGEWGGGLCWYGADGHLQSIYDDWPVTGVLRFGPHDLHEYVLAIAGLRHMGLDEGELLRAERDGSGAWRTKQLTALHHAPFAFAEEPHRLVVVTSDGIERVEWGSWKATIVHRGAWSALWPTSVAVLPDGTIYVGMRHAVARLTPFMEGYRERWLVPPRCDERESSCRCERGQFLRR